MNRLLIVGLVIILTVPLYAQDQRQNVDKLKVDTRNAVGVIGADKRKTRTYCQILDLREQLGPEFATLDNILKDLDLSSPDGREIALIIQSLVQSCPD